MSNYAVFTVCNLAYLYKAMVLAESVKQYSDVKLKIYIIDRKVDIMLPNEIAEFCWVEDCGITDFYQLAFKYDITELSTSVKPWISLRLLQDYAKVVFLDPDTCLYGKIEPILEELNTYSTILTPHYLIPQADDLENCDIGMLRFGSFNLGFFAVNQSLEANKFLQWWHSRCMQYCFFETQFGLSTDQKWVSIAPCFFNDMLISRDFGRNVAFWNAHERKITKVDERYYINGEFPLVFFHFSSFDESHPDLLSKRSFFEQKTLSGAIVELAESYNDNLLMWKQKLNINTRYGFDYMYGGEYISPTLRRAYVAILKELPKDHDPFASKGIVGKFAKKNYLVEKSRKTYVPQGYSDASNYKRQFIIINVLMKLLLRILGANKFNNLSRLFVYLSSFRQNRDLWKL